MSGVSPYHPVEAVRAEIGPGTEGEVAVRLFLTFVEPALSESPVSPRNREKQHAPSPVLQGVSRSTVYDDYLDAIEERVECLRAESSP